MLVTIYILTTICIYNVAEDCWAKTLARLLQAAFNLQDENNPYTVFMPEDLVAHLKSKEKSKKVSTLELKNVKSALAHIKSKGILTGGGRNKVFVLSCNYAIYLIINLIRRRVRF